MAIKLELVLVLYPLLSLSWLTLALSEIRMRSRRRRYASLPIRHYLDLQCEQAQKEQQLKQQR